jgi:hypothetical protein
MNDSKLFSKQGDWWNNAIVGTGYSFSNKWESYATGYKTAAEVLSEKVLTELTDRDTLIYPILYLYRHYFELRLKEIIEHGNRLLDRDYQPVFTHNLDRLWVLAKPLVVELWPESPTEDLLEMEMVFKEMTVYDAASMSFRYLVDKNGLVSTGDLTVINIQAFIDSIKNTVAYLEGISMGISVFEDYRSDMVRDYQ